MLIDTHCHLNIMASKQPEERLTPELLASIAPIIEKVVSAGVTKMVTVGTSLAESYNCIAVAERYPSQVAATIGVHPCDVAGVDPEDMITQMSDMLSVHKSAIVAIGEIGLDYYHLPHDKEAQKRIFSAQLELAAQHHLPVVIHIRDGLLEKAGNHALTLLRACRKRLKTGVIHCFSLDKKAAQEVISWGWYIGIDGPITYPKNQQLRDIVAAVPLSGLVLETDAPFLPPQEFRGKPNCPSNLVHVAQAIAQARKISYEEVAAATTKNARRLYGLV